MRLRLAHCRRDQPLLSPCRMKNLKPEELLVFQHIKASDNMGVLPCLVCVLPFAMRPRPDTTSETIC